LNLRHYHFDIEKLLKGEIKDSIIIETGFGGGDCGYQFQEGVEYLVYAYKKERGYSTSICSRTTSLGASICDSIFFDKMPQILSRSSLLGVIRYWGNNEGFVDMKNLKVTLWNKENHYVTSTSTRGSYFFYDIKPGEYNIELDIADSLYFSPYDSTVRIDSLQCEEQFIYLRPNTQISGRAVFLNGLPASRVELSIVPADTQSLRHSLGYFESVVSDDSGYFRFRKGITLGRYFVAINPNGPTVKFPLRPTFYPRSDLMSHAATIDLKTATTSRDILFIVASQPTPVYSVSGYCVYKDSLPAGNIEMRLSLKMLYNTDNLTVTTGKDGSFSFKATEGQKLWIDWFNFQVESEKEVKQFWTNHKAYTPSFIIFNDQVDTLQVVNNISHLNIIIGASSTYVKERIQKYRASNRQQ
jgi:hypothetical protein